MDGNGQKNYEEPIYEEIKINLPKIVEEKLNEQIQNLEIELDKFKQINEREDDLYCIVGATVKDADGYKIYYKEIRAEKEAKLRAVEQRVTKIKNGAENVLKLCQDTEIQEKKLNKRLESLREECKIKKIWNKRYTEQEEENQDLRHQLDEIQKKLVATEDELMITQAGAHSLRIALNNLVRCTQTCDQAENPRGTDSRNSFRQDDPQNFKDDSNDLFHKEENKAQKIKK